MRKLPFALIGLLLTPLVLLSSVLTSSVADISATSSQKAVIQIAEVPEEVEEAHEHSHDDEDLASAAGRTVEAFRARALAARSQQSSTATKQPTRIAVKPQKREPELLAVVDQPEIRKTHRIIADNALRQMPEQCRDNLQTFYVRYDNPEHRGLAGRSLMILDGSVPDDEFRALFIHEFGHIIDIGCHSGHSYHGESRFVDGKDPIYADDPSIGFYEISWTTSTVQHSDARADDFVSGYASYDVFEDFAESFSYFVLQNDAFKKRAETNVAIAAKYNWILQNVFNGVVPTLATGETTGFGKVPWDTTKLPYVWHKATSVAYAN